MRDFIELTTFDDVRLLLFVDKIDFFESADAFAKVRYNGLVLAVQEDIDEIKAKLRNTRTTERIYIYSPNWETEGKAEPIAEEIVLPKDDVDKFRKIKSRNKDGSVAVSIILPEEE